MSKPENQDNEEEYIIDWHLEYLEEYLKEQGKIAKDFDWLNQHMYPEIYKAVIHLVQSGKQDFYHDSRFFELFAVDFLLDENLKLFFLENNFNPQILAVSEGRVKRHI